MIGIIIIARLGSSRLPGKHLMKINEKTIMEWLIMRIQSQLNEKIIIATSTKSENKQFNYLKNLCGVDIFYGNDGNIPLRLLECAEKYNLTKLICIGGDNPLTSINACKIVINELDNKDYVETYGLPIGMNVFGFTYKLLKNNLTDEYKNKIDLEFCWHSIFNNNINKIKLDNYDIEKSDIRVTLDYKDDYEFFKNVIEYIGNNILLMTDDEIINIIYQNQFNKINNHLTEKYWNNFNQGIKKTYNTNKKYNTFKN